MLCVCVCGGRWVLGLWGCVWERGCVLGFPRLSFRVGLLGGSDRRETKVVSGRVKTRKVQVFSPFNRSSS